MPRTSRRGLPGLRSYASFLVGHRLRLAATLTSFTVSQVLLSLVPYAIGRFVGALAAHPVQRGTAMDWFWVLVALSSLHDLGWRLSEYLFLRNVLPIKFAYEARIFRSVIRKPYHYFVDKLTGKVASYTTTLAEETGEITERACFNYSTEVVTMVVLTAILVDVNWVTGAIFVGSVLLLLLVARLSILPSVRAERSFADTNSSKNGRIIDIVGNFVSVKSFQTERSEASVVRREQDRALAGSRKSFLRAMVFWGSASVVVRHVIWPATIGANLWLFLHHDISLGQLATVLSTLLIFSEFIWQVIFDVSQLNLKVARVEEAHAYLFGKDDIGRADALEDELPTPAFTRSLAISDLSFSYPDGVGDPVLTDLTLTLRPGEKVGLVGRSGSGKSTITKLLLGYYDAPAGTLRLDGRDVTSRELARLISLVPQDTNLFHRSIADNIAYAAARDVTPEEVRAAAVRAHADEFIARVPEAYAAMVGERGVKLSAGQRQRIAIARAFLDDKPLLVLDEATSALDSESEVLVQEALERLWHGKTVIAIAHRLSTLRTMDRIVVLDGGRIVEQGSHDELVDAGGLYARLWQHQSGGFIAA